MRALTCAVSSIVTTCARIIRFFVILVLGTAVPLAGGDYQSQTDEAFWESSEVDLEFTKRFFSNEICEKSETLKASCERIRQLILSRLPKELKTASLTTDDLLVKLDQALGPGKKQLYGSIINEQIKAFDGHGLVIPTPRMTGMLGRSNDQTVIGIGILYDLTRDGVYLRFIAKGSPAEKAGFKVHDRLDAINGTKINADSSAFEVLHQLSRKIGAESEVQITRQQTAQTLKVKTARIPFRAVDVDFKSFRSLTFGVVAIRSFREGVCQEVTEKVRFMNTRASGLILDLRFNQGGLVEEAQCVFALFAGSRVMVDQKVVDDLIPKDFALPAAVKVEGYLYGRGRAQFDEIPLVVLVNASTASAAEMLAAGLQDAEQGLIIGERTFGKGTIQAIDPIEKKLSFVRTVKRYVRSDGSEIQAVGVTPDLQLPMQSSASGPRREYLREVDLSGLGPSASEPSKAVDRQSLSVCTVDKRGELKKWAAGLVNFEDQQLSSAFVHLVCLQQTARPKT